MNETPERLYLVVTVDIDPALDEEFHQWYEQVHVPEIVACPGIHSGRRMKSPDLDQRPRYVTIYELDSKEALETPEVRAVAGWGPFADRVSNYHRYWFNPVGTPVSADAGAGDE